MFSYDLNKYLWINSTKKERKIIILYKIIIFVIIDIFLFNYKQIYKLLINL